jgi:hypothetical protein
MLRNLFMTGVACAPLYAADDEGGADGAPDNVAPADPPGDAAPQTDAADGGDTVVDAPKGFEALPEWAQKELNKKHARIKEREDALTAERAENQRLKEMLEAQQRRAPTGDAAPPSSAPTATPTLTPAITDDDPRVLAAAQRLAARQNDERIMADIRAKGSESYGEKWVGAIQTLSNMGIDEETINQIKALDTPHKVFFELGSNPARYQQLQELTPAKRLTELVKMSMETAPAPAPKNKPSSAPQPVDAIGGRGGAPNDDVYDPKLATPEHDDEWFRRRRAQKMNSSGRPWSPTHRPA